MFISEPNAERLLALAVCIGCAALGISSARGDDSSSPTVAQAPPSAKAPWDDVLSQAGELPSFRETCFSTFDTSKSLTQVEDLRQWFEIIAGQPQGIVEAKTRLGKCSAIDGLVKLNAPWKEDMALRLAVEDYNRLQIHFFRGEQGATLVYHEDDMLRWAGYATTRKPRGITPLTWVMAATDEWRNRRTSPKNHDYYQLHCRAGDVILTRGDVILLRLPLGGLPEDVFFQGKAAFHGLSIVRTRDFPTLPEPPAGGRVVVPGECTWFQQLDEQAQVDKDATGGMRLSVPERPKKRSWIATPLPRETLHEIVLELSDASPGSGIYLGNGKEGPRYVLRHVLDRRSRQLCMLVHPDDDLDEHDFRGLTELPLPAVAPRHWLRLVFGAGQLRWWVSPDAVHWAEGAEPIRNLAPDVTHIGLHCVSRREATGITLRRITMRQLTQLTTLASAELRQQAAIHDNANSLGAWLADITELAPAQCDTNEWRRACAIRTLAAGCSRGLGNELLMLLVDDEFTRGLPLERQLRALDEAALLLELWDDNALLQRLIKRFHEAGRAAFEGDDGSPFSAIRQPLMSTPIASRHQLEIATEELLRAELIKLVYERQWQRIRELGQELRFFQFQQKSPLLDWAESLSLRQLPATAIAGARVDKQKEEWRELVIEDLNKDVYNLLAQLRVELNTPSREDAARTVVSIDRGWPVGVAPHWQDNQLLVSLPTAVRSAVRHDEPLRKLLADNYRDLAALRVGQAMARNDAEMVELAADQFVLTDAAVEAFLWLADRALASGWFDKAAAEYRHAWQLASPGMQSRIAGKLRLAETLAGGHAGQPAAGPVEMGGAQISTDEFEKLVTELADRVAHDSARRIVDVGPNSRSVPVPPPASYAVQRRARLDGPVGNDPHREFARDTARRQLDWVDRQLGIAVDANLMYVCNRFQVAAYDLQSKQRVWQTGSPPGQIQFAQQSTFTVARPLLSRDRIFARVLYDRGGTLTCIDRSNGQYVWTVTPPQNDELVSDPFFLRGELACFKLVHTEQNESMLRLILCDVATGAVWREQDVMRLRDSWRRRRYCEFVATPDGGIVTLGGAIANLDTAGRIRWIRQQTSLPPDEEPQWVSQFFQPPFVVGHRVYVFQPGVRTLECVERDTGLLVWSRLFLEMERLVGVIGPLLICQNGNGLLAIDNSDGHIRWRHDADGVTCGVTCGAEGDIVYVQRVPVDPGRTRYRPRLVWVNSSNGVPRATAELPDLEEPDPRIGPLVFDHDRLWTFWGRGQNEPTRDVVELTPAGPGEAWTPRDAPDVWTRHVDERLAAAAAKIMPEWRILHGEFGDGAGLIPEVHGERQVVGLRFRNTGPITIGREVSLPAKSKPRLRLRFGNETSHVWKVEVRFRGQAIWSQETNPSHSPQPWKQFEVDLAQVAGQQGWLTVRGFLPQGGDAPLYWKTLEIVF